MESPNLLPETSDELREKIEKSEIGVDLIYHPLMAVDKWGLDSLGYSEHEMVIASYRNFYFSSFNLPWLKTFSKLTILYSCSISQSHHTVNGTLRALKKLDIYLYKSSWLYPQDICERVLQDFFNQYSGGSKNTIVRGITYCLKLWNEEGWMSINFTKPKFKKSNPEIKILPEEVLYQFYSNLHLFPPILERLFRLQIALGCRLGELLIMPRACLKREGNDWFIQRYVEKVKEWKFVQIHPSLAELVRAQQTFLNNELNNDENFQFLFCRLSVRFGKFSLNRFERQPTYQARALTFSLAMRWLTDFCEKVDLKDADGNGFKVTSHMLRRTKACIMAFSETEDEYIAAVLGHKSLDMLPHYRNFSIERLERQAKEKNAIYVDMNGQSTKYKPKHTRYEELHEILIVDTPLGECHRPSMLGDCELLYACLNCHHHRVTIKDKPYLERDLSKLIQTLKKAETQNNTRKILEISPLVDFIQRRLEGLDTAETLHEEELE